MNINLTLIAQSVAFFLFAFLCWRFIWPLIVVAMEERRQRIERGLTDAAAAEQALEDGKKLVAEQKAKARERAEDIIKNAEKVAAETEQQGREKGKQEAERIRAEGREQVEQLLRESRQELREQVATLVYEGVEKIIEKNVDRELNDRLVKDLIQRL